MRISFLGDVNSCNPIKIGGSEAYIRRLASALISKGYPSSIVMYGSDRDQELEWNNLKLFYFRSFSRALKEIASQSPDYVVETYIHKRYYLQYLFFKKQRQNKNKFIIIFQVWPMGRVRRYLTIRIRTLFCSLIFAVSPRLVKELKKWGILAIWLPPSVPDHYFSCPSKKEGKITVSYFGRISPDKGIDNLIKVFGSISKSFLKRSLFKIYGYYDSSNKESTILYKKLKKLKRVECQIQPHKIYQYSFQEEELLSNRLRETDILILPYENLDRTLDIPLLILSLIHI